VVFLTFATDYVLANVRSHDPPSEKGGVANLTRKINLTPGRAQALPREQGFPAETRDVFSESSLACTEKHEL
jgi:hypothetical protein